MAKKKKTQLKPVLRGFATTSVAKKAVPEQNAEAEEHTEENTTEVEASSIVDVDGRGSDPAHLEEQALQSLVDKFQDRTEKEITRTIKVFCRSLL